VFIYITIKTETAKIIRKRVINMNEDKTSLNINEYEEKKAAARKSMISFMKKEIRPADSGELARITGTIPERVIIYLKPFLDKGLIEKKFYDGKFWYTLSEEAANQLSEQEILNAVNPSNESVNVTDASIQNTQETLSFKMDKAISKKENTGYGEVNNNILSDADTDPSLKSGQQQNYSKEAETESNKTISAQSTEIKESGGEKINNTDDNANNSLNQAETEIDTKEDLLKWLNQYGKPVSDKEASEILGLPKQRLKNFFISLEKNGEAVRIHFNGKTCFQAVNRDEKDIQQATQIKLTEETEVSAAKENTVNSANDQFKPNDIQAVNIPETEAENSLKSCSVVSAENAANSEDSVLDEKRDNTAEYEGLSGDTVSAERGTDLQVKKINAEDTEDLFKCSGKAELKGPDFTLDLPDVFLNESLTNSAAKYSGTDDKEIFIDASEFVPDEYDVGTCLTKTKLYSFGIKYYKEGLNKVFETKYRNLFYEENDTNICISGKLNKNFEYNFYFPVNKGFRHVFISIRGFKNPESAVEKILENFTLINSERQLKKLDDVYFISEFTSDISEEWIRLIDQYLYEFKTLKDIEFNETLLRLKNKYDAVPSKVDIYELAALSAMNNYTQNLDSLSEQIIHFIDDAHLKDITYASVRGVTDAVRKYCSENTNNLLALSEKRTITCTSEKTALLKNDLKKLDEKFETYFKGLGKNNLNISSAEGEKESLPVKENDNIFIDSSFSDLLQKQLEITINQNNTYSFQDSFNELKKDRLISEVPLTYEKKQSRHVKNWSMDIPDCFVIKDDAQAGFTAVYKSSSEIYIEMSASAFIEQKISVDIADQEVYAQLFGYLYYECGLYKQYEKMYEKTEYLVTKAGGCIYGIKDNIHHFHFMVCLNEGFQDIHIQISGYPDKTQTLTDFAVSLMAGFKPDKALMKYKKLNDSYFLNDLDESKLSEWRRTLSKFTSEYRALVRMQINKENALIRAKEIPNQSEYFENKMEQIVQEQENRLDQLALEIISFNEHVSVEELAFLNNEEIFKAEKDFYNTYRRETIQATKADSYIVVGSEFENLLRSVNLLEKDIYKYKKYTNLVVSAAQMAVTASPEDSSDKNKNLFCDIYIKLDLIPEEFEAKQEISALIHQKEKTLLAYSKAVSELISQQEENRSLSERLKQSETKYIDEEKQYEIAKEKYNSFMRQADKEISEYESNLEALQQDYAHLIKAQEEIRQQLKNTSLFKFGVKKQLNNKLDELENQKKDINEQISFAKTKIEQSKNDTELKKAEYELNLQNENARLEGLKADNEKQQKSKGNYIQKYKELSAEILKCEDEIINITNQLKKVAESKKHSESHA
jgi:hypothetical protein